MKITDTKKVALYIDELSKEEYRRDRGNKEIAYKNALQYCERFMPIEDKKAFKSDMYGYFEAAYLGKYRNEFPPVVSDSKIFELASIDTDKIKALQRKYEAISVPSKAPDFNVYATTPEQIERYELLTDICEAINNARGIIPVNNFGLMNGLSRTITHDFARIALHQTLGMCFRGEVKLT